MCSDALGTELGRAKNFRVVDFERTLEDGTRVTAAGVVADVHLLKSAHDAPQGDLAKHVLSVAAEDPTQFGQSIVFTYGDWVVKDKDGNRHSYNEEVRKPFDEWLEKHEHAGYIKKCAKEQELIDEWNAKSADGKYYVVLGKLHGTDFTDTPAATDGIFSTNTLAEEAETMLEEHPQILEVFEKSPKSVVEFLERTGLDKKLESARVAGLQAAKDKEIAELKKQAEPFAAFLAENGFADLEAIKAALSAKDAEIAELKAANEKFQSDIAKTTEALAAAKCETVEQLCTRLGETEEALSKEKAAHQVDIERYREQVGAALALPGAEGAKLEGREAVAASVKIVAG